MYRFVLIVAGFFALVSCDRGGQLQTSGARTQPAAAGTAQAAYETACAGCHEDGKDGAPRTRHPEDWEGRSELWQSVLIEHANSGYRAMPAKGGDESLREDEIAAAAQYMLELTHRNIPPD